MESNGVMASLLAAGAAVGAAAGGMVPADYRFRVEFWAVVGCLTLCLGIVELIRRNRLKERYSLLWFATVGVLFTLTLKRDWLGDLASTLGVYYPPTALFLVLVFFMLIILMHFSTVISRLLGEKQTLVQQLAILDSRVRSLEGEGARGDQTRLHLSK